MIVMSLFPIKKIKIEKIVKQGIFQYFIDYAKQKNSDIFLQDFFLHYSENDNALLVVDSTMFYEKKNSEIENIFKYIMNELNQKEIGYKEFVAKRDSDKRILGMKVTTAEKVNHYQIGVVVNSEQIREVVGIIKQFNTFCYIIKDSSVAELTNQYNELRGDIEELNEISNSYLYHDSSFRRICIYSKQDITDFIETTVQECEKLK